MARHLNEHAIAITGMGMVTSLGEGVDKSWASLVQGISGIKLIERFSRQHLISAIAGTLDYLEDVSSSSDRCCEAVRRAIAEALEQGGYHGISPGPLVMATTPLDHEWHERLSRLPPGSSGADNLVWDGQSDDDRFLKMVSTSFYIMKLREEFSIPGIPLQLHTACASGSSAIQIGCELIRYKLAQSVLVAATDVSVTPESITKFGLLGALSTRNDDPQGASRPFTRSRDGFVMSEGAAAMVLEDAAAARARRADILAFVVGCGESVDTYHRTRNDPEATAIIKAIMRTLADAELNPEDIDYINAHGTSTPDNDIIEATALAKIFGAKPPPLSSNKSMIGHTLSAAGLIEAIITVQTLRHGVLPPTINYDEPDPKIPLDVVPNTARDAPVRFALSNSFGFGGQNVCLAFARD